ncbi:MAG: hypothetical protein RLZZ301_959 [Bacteroidota bacterium]|jgi:hypothetical protein
MKQKTNKKNYQAPKIEQVKLDTEISLVMTSPVVPSNPGGMPQIPEYVQKIFKFGW